MEKMNKKQDDKIVNEKMKEANFKLTSHPGLYVKEIQGVGTVFCDFRKNKNGNLYGKDSSNNQIPDSVIKGLDEYKIIHGGDFQPASSLVCVDDKMMQSSLDVSRGTEDNIREVIQQRNLDLISKASDDKTGGGILYHDLGKKIGFEPSVELVDMICASMGSISTELVEHGMHHLMDENDGSVYQTYFAIVKAVDGKTGMSGLGTSEEIIDFEEMKSGRTFSLTKVIRKARRNALEQLIPVPKKALVLLIQEIMKSRKEGNGNGGN